MYSEMSASRSRAETRLDAQGCHLVILNGYMEAVGPLAASSLGRRRQRSHLMRSKSVGHTTMFNKYFANQATS